MDIHMAIYGSSLRSRRERQRERERERLRRLRRERRRATDELGSWFLYLYLLRLVRTINKKRAQKSYEV